MCLVHGAAHVHQEQDLDLVVALGLHADVQQAGVGGGAVDGASRSSSSSSPRAQSRRRRRSATLMLQGAQLDAVVIVAVGALLPDLDGALLSPLPPMRMPRVEATAAKRAGAAGANPLAAALVAFLLLFETFLSVSISSSQPIFSIAAFCSGVSSVSSVFLSQSRAARSGRSASDALK